MSTNGHFLTPEMGAHLKALGLDKVRSAWTISTRSCTTRTAGAGAYKKAIDRHVRAREAGLSVVIQTVVTHQNCPADR